MKKLDYTSLFLSMVSLVWMLTMLQELPAVAQTAPSASAHLPLAESAALVQPGQLRPTAEKQSHKSPDL
ncbi:MAG: hypothetical protein ICV62_04110 [Cyanobacteria bacterium Co-bin13]|nr:hypothetical protein [Cyanobacteria bacterium Co-bin13]